MLWQFICSLEIPLACRLLSKKLRLQICSTNTIPDANQHLTGNHIKGTYHFNYSLSSMKQDIYQTTLANLSLTAVHYSLTFKSYLSMKF